MSTKMGKRSELSTSTPSAKKQTKKIRPMPSKLGASLTKYGQAKVLSRPSSSRLADLYTREEFVNEWANNLPFHVARNVLHLRRYRGLSQSTLANAMGTSQSAIARIESAQENITLDTLQRLVIALKGQFHISISPQEYSLQQQLPWWELATSGHPWTVVDWVFRSTVKRDQVIVALERPRQHYITQAGTSANTGAELLPEAKTL
jgi:transcriptional regulator with XRE-family HTH domain